jgi:hypothetical protein
MDLSAMSDSDLVSDLAFAQSVMDSDSEIDDVQLEYANGDVTSYRELLEEAAKRAKPYAE